MAKIKITLPEGKTLYDGMQVTFKTPCASTAADEIVVNDVSFSLMSSAGTVCTGNPSFYAEVFVSVLLDTANHKAYLLNDSCPPSAQYSVQAEYAYEADTALYADEAAYAVDAYSAEYANEAGSAGDAGHATEADHALKADETDFTNAEWETFNPQTSLFEAGKTYQIRFNDGKQYISLIVLVLDLPDADSYQYLPYIKAKTYSYQPMMVRSSSGIHFGGNRYDQNGTAIGTINGELGTFYRREIR